MRTWHALPLLCIALSGCADAQTPVEIADGREGGELDASQTDIASWDARPEIEQATAAARAYWRGQDAGYEEEVRVMDVAEGAFTEAGTEQQAVLYLMSLWPRCCPKMGLAIVEGGRLVRNVAFEGIAQTLAAVPDLDGDGRDDLVSTGEFGMGGETSRSVTISGFGDDGFADRGSTSLSQSTCATGRDDSGGTASRVVALPGPEFRVARYTQASCESTVWKPAGAEEPLVLDAPGTAYVDLPVR